MEGVLGVLVLCCDEHGEVACWGLVDPSELVRVVRLLTVEERRMTLNQNPEPSPKRDLASREECYPDSNAGPGGAA